MSPAPQVAPSAPGLRELYASGRFAEALALYRASEETASEAVEPATLAAIAAARIGAFDEAWQLATTTLVHATRAHDRGGQLRLLNLIGGVSFERGDLERAEAAFTSAARVATDLGDRLSAAKAWNNLGILTHLRRHPLSAVEFLMRALDVYLADGNALGLAQTRYNLSIVHRDLGEYDRAGTHLDAAMAAVEQAGDPGLRGLILLGRAELAIHQGALERAAADLAAGRQVATDTQDPLGEAEAARVEARLALREGRYPSAQFAARRGARTARIHNARILEAECDALCAQALLGLWKAEEALEEHQDAVARLRAAGANRLAIIVDREWKAARA